jgi:hypothetical protein
MLPSLRLSDAALLSVPESGNWTLMMWHINLDSLERYAGEKFEVAWEDFAGQ